MSDRGSQRRYCPPEFEALPTEEEDFSQEGQQLAPRFYKTTGSKPSTMLEENQVELCKTDDESGSMVPLNCHFDRPNTTPPPEHPLGTCSKMWMSIRQVLVWCRCLQPLPLRDRTVLVGKRNIVDRYPRNVVRNQKYTILTFLPLSLYGQFKYFFNLYFLAVAISQFYPPLQVGFLFTYVAPLAFVIAIALLKEAYDDMQRFRRDREANSEKFEALDTETNQWVELPSRDITVGMLLKLGPGKRVPADCILLKTTEKDGSFIKTDQLDGETDWKLRLAVPHSQSCSYEDLRDLNSSVWAEAPHPFIYKFQGRYMREGERMGHDEGMPLTDKNTMWANTVVATGTCVVLVIYTGKETRSSLNANQPSSKIGLIDLELNYLSKLLFILTLLLALLLVGLQRFAGEWYVSLFRFVLLFSSIIPISLRVNLDMGKAVYSFFIMQDKKIEGVVVRNSNLPEELGRIGYLFSDKTGTLTQNDMVFKKLYTGKDTARGWLSSDSDDMYRHVREWFGETEGKKPAGCEASSAGSQASGLGEREDTWGGDFMRAASQRQRQDLVAAVTAIAVAHNVTPVECDGKHEYQASSPDEVALVRFAETVGMALQYRDRHSMTLLVGKKELVVPTAGLERFLTYHKEMGMPQVAGVASLGDAPAVLHEVASWTVAAIDGKEHSGPFPDPSTLGSSVTLTVENRLYYTILEEFPFTSESKRMGIIVKHLDTATGEEVINLFMKGADSVMSKIVGHSPWLAEECTNLAKDGLRTLVFGSKQLSKEEYDSFTTQFKAAQLARNPAEAMERIRTTLEKDLELVGLSGVEDKLQDDVAKTLEHLRNAGVKIWMLTGDKVETATCIARSTKLVARNGNIFPFDCMTDSYEYMWQGREWRPGKPVDTEQDALDYLSAFEQYMEFGDKRFGVTMVIDGHALEAMLKPATVLQFVEQARQAASVVVARCSPTQKADVVQVIKNNLPKGCNLRSAAIGDGGNDVSMILAADVGLGVEGKEGRHASLAADFSLKQFSHCLRLITWHGRNSYKRSARLSQFVIHRGLIISIIQAIFSAIFYFMSVPIYTGWLLVGYSTVYTMFPVFAIVLDEDVSEKDVLEFPELYKELHKSRCLNLRTFLQWVFKAVYQGGAIMLMAMYLFESSFVRIVSITFTALILTELVTVWFEMHKITWPFVVAEVLSVGTYVISFFVLDAFDLQYIGQSQFWWKVFVITALACAPVIAGKYFTRRCCEPSYSKLNTRDPWIFVLIRWVADRFRSQPHRKGSSPEQPLLF
eukprot:Sspe_Gene.44555::Locus_21865_Transcript_1_1_Confidence_1.000_Length_3924::g.44555::m.44555/K01530/E3.6.3.1; phospholipid-translocating ATPase